jgi:hypothetical protein
VVQLVHHLRRQQGKGIAALDDTAAQPSRKRKASDENDAIMTRSKSTSGDIELDDDLAPEIGIDGDVEDYTGTDDKRMTTTKTLRHDIVAALSNSNVLKSQC